MSNKATILAYSKYFLDNLRSCLTRAMKAIGTNSDLAIDASVRDISIRNTFV